MQVVLENDEKILLERLREGDQYAFSLLYDRYKFPLASNLLKFLKSDDLAEEALQDLFIKVWENRLKIDPNKPFKAFLYGVAKNLVYDIFRKSARDKRLEDQLMQGAIEYSHIEEGLYQKEYQKLLDETIALLPPQRRLVFTLFKIEGKSYKEISEMLGISHSTINDHVQKANIFLKTRLSSSSKAFFLFFSVYMLR
ncbi:RNA polymerase sigma factor [Desertivirga brevis]|uniref:RNA polymerase sigma factor n=1 Tax=Desertivirga brevis TaxID=2810310 RepID=UPI001A974878|nr:RNA polymerase sigma-70 factor [Pedobacter sp. SYSU D00873]